jgi:dienelactone hydrolase
MSEGARVRPALVLALASLLPIACAPAPTPTPLEPSQPRCTASANEVTCAHNSTVLHAAGLDRGVFWQTPGGTAPTGGWPAVLLFQGSYLPAHTTWTAQAGATFGVFFQVQLVQHLLDAGFVVLTPEAKLDGNSYWDTNIPPWASNWPGSSDHALMLAIFEELAKGTFGPVDPTRLYATGISSGGYMTSRMAEAYPGRFRALAIASASWATCGGPACALPAAVPARHPPTLFLHGELDSVVPISTARSFEAQLRGAGVETRFISDPAIGHGWLAVAPAEVTAFFTSHP